MAVHYSDQAISEARGGARRAIMGGPTDEATEVFKRLASSTVPATIGWFMGEVNLQTHPARLEGALARSLGWMASSLARNSPTPLQALDTIFALARQDAERFLAEAVVVKPPATERPDG